ncbi:hypothetical protein K490DRAFT_68217 [Saccharata proteae CBS 121410]|uniref:Uncharacterized protein n=1 Tax=Saccharata proteae CBS 121410 TaxID=1314787 RepID=A0A9P4HQY1_9PEZI|nr:hypothetical protein K490DRAFT_68217 [Saccharata proteae CBS 121410]
MSDSVPLSPIPSASLNARTPSTARRVALGSAARNSPKSPLINMDDMSDEVTWEDGPSSPFISTVDQENVPPGGIESKTESRKSSVQIDENTVQLAPKSSSRPPPVAQTPSKSSRKNSVVSIIHDGEEAVSSPALRDNEGLTKAIEIMQEDGNDPTFGDISYYNQGTNLEAEEPAEEADEDPMEETNVDDTCFSAFSEVPNADMTQFARLGRSPTKTLFSEARTPRKTPGTPGTARKREYHGYDRSPSPTPRRHKNPTIREEREEGNDTTNLLLDFTQQMESFSSSSHRTLRARHSPSKSATQPNLLSYLNDQRSPTKGSVATTPKPRERRNTLLNLLDFDLPPAPTPRSIPTITVRELESVKSGYQSQISSLTATLSGRAAEVDSLKKAVADAERRVGESQELVREEVSKREHAEREKLEWVKRGTEVEEVLESIREEVISSERDREDVLRKLEESERRAEEAEARAADLEARAIEAEGKIVDQSVMTTADDAQRGAGAQRFTAEEVQKQIDEKVATLCRELHVVYKKKHETKVAALKKSYEAKAEKKHAELAKQVDVLQKQVEELQASKENTFSGVLPAGFADAAGSHTRDADLKRLEEQKQELEEQKARLAGLAGEVEAVRTERRQLLRELENERKEKGELVAAVDEMLALQAEDSVVGGAAAGSGAVEDFRRSITGAGAAGAGAHAGVGSASKPSGLTRPGFGESRIGGGGVGGMPRPTGLPRGGLGKSRMMSNIERMGGGGRHGE